MRNGGKFDGKLKLTKYIEFSKIETILNNEKKYITDLLKVYGLEWQEKQKLQSQICILDKLIVTFHSHTD